MTAKGFKKFPLMATCHPNKKEYCKGLCKNCYNVQWRIKNIDRELKRERLRRNKNRDADKAYHRQWKLEHHDRVLEKHREYRERNSEVLLKKHRIYNDLNREQINAHNREYMLKHPQHGFSSHLKRRYQLTVDEYNGLIKSQGGGCAICGNSRGKKRLCVDHDHTTGNIRGILCDNCNVGIGRLKDDIDILKKAIKYLRKYKND